MSHVKERKESICLNCNAAVYGRFCHICGQENIETKESFWALASHFIADIFHYDGKFLRTIRLLLFKPGFLTTAYIVGKRTSYLHPIRLYIFTSAFFFLLYFSFFYNPSKIDKIKISNNKKKEILYTKDYQNKLTEVKENLLSEKNDKKNKYLANDIKQLITDATLDSVIICKDSSYAKKIDFEKYKVNNNIFLSISDTPFSSLKQYDSLQLQLPPNYKDGFLRNYLQHKNLKSREVSKGLSSDQILKKIFDLLAHKFPQMLFVYLPFFSLTLMLVYIRNKQYFFVNHVVFTLHFFCGIFLIILLMAISNAIINSFNFSSKPVFFLIIFFLFLYKSFKNFYAQSTIKTILKLSLLSFINIIIFSILFIVFLLIAALNIN